jgi:hypothetical protein
MRSNRALLSLLVLVGAGSADGCLPGRSAGEYESQVSFALTLPSGGELTVLHWAITSASSFFTAQGDIDTSGPGASASVLTAFPASTGDIVTLNGITTDGLFCSGQSAPFDVGLGQAVSVSVGIACGGPQISQPSTVSINATVSIADACPVISSFSVSPLTTGPGGVIIASAVATDADPGDHVTYLWQAQFGALHDPPAQQGNTAVFTCPADGRVDGFELFLTLSDDHAPTPCSTHLSTIVRCVVPNTDDAGSDGGGTSIACAQCEMNATNVLGACFATSTTPNSGPTDPTSFGCEGFTGDDRTHCLALLDCIRTGNGSGTTCAVGDDPTACLCGSLTPTVCGGMAPATLPGICRDVYLAAAGSNDIFSVFFSTDSPVGVANNLLTCDVDVPCPCVDPPRTDVDGGSTDGSAGDGGDDAGGGGSAGTSGDASAAPDGGGGTGGLPHDGGPLSSGDPCALCELAATSRGDCFDTFATGGSVIGCDAFTGADRGNCFALLDCVRTGNGSGTTCAVGDDATPCLCGSLTPSVCVGIAPATLPGICRDLYLAAAGSDDIFDVFFSPDSPVGIVNNLLACDVDAPCACLNGQMPI